MTPEAKAAELIHKFRSINEWSPGDGGYMSLGVGVAKKCAITCVEQIIQVAWWSSTDEMPNPYRESQKEYWIQVLDHIKQQ